jgi:hypothetical protein
MRLTALCAGIALLLVSGTAIGSISMRCGSHLIEAGDTHPPTMQEVMKYCGKPDEQKWSELIYKKQQRRLLFDAEGRLETIHRLDDHDAN